MDYNEISSDNNDDISLDMSDGSSVFDEPDGLGVELGTRPYQFEPEADSDEELVDENNTQPSEDERLGNIDWCTCEQCVAMPNAEECVCCQEIPEIRCVTEEDHRHCITQHNGFSPVCLHPSVLRTAYHSYRQQYAELPETNGRMRYIGYRQLVRWCWGWLGKEVRVTLPACAVHKIRTTYPEEDGHYTGFSCAGSE